MALTLRDELGGEYEIHEEPVAWLGGRFGRAGLPTLLTFP
jgi:hypothetical protein